MPRPESATAEAIWADVVQAHGGLARWRALDAIEAEVSCRGLLFTLKGQPPIERARVVADTRAPRLTVHGPWGPGRLGEWREDTVQIRGEDGAVQLERAAIEVHALACKSRSTLLSSEPK